MRGDVLPRRARRGRRGVLRARSCCGRSAPAAERDAAARAAARRLVPARVRRRGRADPRDARHRDALRALCSTSPRSPRSSARSRPGPRSRWARALYARVGGGGACCSSAPRSSGHALDGDQPRLLAPLGDLLHLGAAAVWLGGLASLLLAFRRARRRAHRRRRAASRASRSRWCSCSSAARRLARADAARLAEPALGHGLRPHAARQVGAASLVLVALGWLNRRGLAAGFARLRPIALAELLVLLVVVGAVGVLTDLRPGSARGHHAEADAAAAWSQPPPAPPRGRVRRRRPGRPDRGRLRLRRRQGDRDADRRRRRRRHRHAGHDRRRSRRELRPRLLLARGARAGASRVDVGGTPLQFAVPQYAPPRDRRGEPAAARLTTRSKSLVIDERALVGPRQPAGDPLPPAGSREHGLPDQRRLRTETLVGTEGIVIGDAPLGPAAGRRLDRRRRSRRSTLPKAYWTAGARNAYFAAPTRSRSTTRPSRPGSGVRFDPATGHALDAADDRHRALHAARLLGLRPARLDLAAALAVALRLALDELEEARRVLERGEARGRVARTARAAEAAGGGDRARGADEAAERERAEARAPTRAACSWPSMRPSYGAASRRSETCSWT